MSYSLITNALSIIDIRDQGNYGRERVLFRVDTATNLMGYLVLNAKSSGSTSIIDLNQNVFWFPSLEVTAGDFVRLYTRKGMHLTRKGKFGGVPKKYHDFFWGKSGPIFSKTSDAIVLVEIAAWQMASLE